MKHFIFGFLILSFINGCNSSGDKSLHDNADTVTTKSLISQSVSEVFNQDEKLALDSVAKYKLDSVHQSCLKYLYVIYGTEVLTDSSGSKELTIGECSIRLIGFKNKSGGLKTMTYGVFVNDSIPTNVIINTSMGQMINGFDVDIEKKKLNSSTMGESGRISIKNVQALYNSAVKNKLFTDYISAYKTRLHPKFIRVLSSIANQQ